MNVLIILYSAHVRYLREHVAWFCVLYVGLQCCTHQPKMLDGRTKYSMLLTHRNMVDLHVNERSSFEKEHVVPIVPSYFQLNTCFEL